MSQSSPYSGSEMTREGNQKKERKKERKKGREMERVRGKQDGGGAG